MEKMNGILTSRTQLLRSNQQDQKEVSLSPDWGGKYLRGKKSCVPAWGFVFPFAWAEMTQRRKRGVLQCNEARTWYETINYYLQQPIFPHPGPRVAGWGANRERERLLQCNEARTWYEKFNYCLQQPIFSHPRWWGANMCWTHLC